MAELRFGLLAAGMTLEKWEADCIEQLVAIPGVKLAALILDARPPALPNPWYRKWKALRHFNKLGWELYRKRFVDGNVPSRKPVDLSGRLGSLPRIEVNVIRKGKFSEYFSAADVAWIRGQNLDFLLRFGFNIIRGDVLASTRYGVWSFHHDDLEKYRGSPPCFWEIYHRDPQTGVTLQRLTDALDSGIVLRKESFPTCMDSYARNIDRGLRFGVAWPADACRRILAGDEGFVSQPPSSSAAPIYRAPTNLEFARLLWRMIRAPRSA
jgi:hypothetical protein